MFARFDENPAITLQDIKKTKRYGRTDGQTDGRTHGRTHARTHGQRENSIPTTNKVCRGYNNSIILEHTCGTKIILKLRFGGENIKILPYKYDVLWASIRIKIKS